MLVPLTYAQPDFDLRCGIYTARERLHVIAKPSALAMQVRPYMRDLVAERTSLPVNVPTGQTNIFLNGCVLITREFIDTLERHAMEDVLFEKDGRVIAAVTHGDGTREAVLRGLEANSWDTVGGMFRRIETDPEIVTHPWDLIALNAAMLRRDAASFPLGAIDPEAQVSDSAEVVNPGQVHIARAAAVSPGAIIDASNGPVVIDQKASVMHRAVIIGPAYVGPASRIKIGAKIYEGTTVGPVCKVGGEVEETIFHSYANKQHDGFAGHSYFAPWTNVGADSNTSDLKNDYSEVRMVLEDREFRTGRTLLGTIMADHSKCGINTMFNTGTCIGVGCNIYGGDYPPKFIPSFSWGGSGGFREYVFRKFSSVASVVMQRRNKSFTDIEKAAFRHIFDLTIIHRKNFLQ